MKRIARTICMLLTLVASDAVFAEASVIDARLGRNIADRQITGETTEFMLGDKAYIWMKLEGAEGEPLTVTWTHGDRKFPVMVNVFASPSETLVSRTPHLPGAWSVTVKDSAGKTLKELSLTVR